MRINQRNEAVLKEGEATTDLIGDISKIVDSMIGGCFQLQDLSKETDLLKEMNRLAETTGRVLSAKPVGNNDTDCENVKKFTLCRRSPHLKKNFFFKKKLNGNCNIMRVILYKHN